MFEGIAPVCPLCGSPAAGLLGVLGNREHYRCQGCGGQFSREVEHNTCPGCGDEPDQLPEDEEE